MRGLVGAGLVLGGVAIAFGTLGGCSWKAALPSGDPAAGGASGATGADARYADVAASDADAREPNADTASDAAPAVDAANADAVATDASDSRAGNVDTACGELLAVACPVMQACVPANPTPEVVARHISAATSTAGSPFFLTASADYVAWYDAPGNVIRRVGTAGCGERAAEVVTTPLVPTQSGISPVAGLALDGHTLYWIQAAYPGGLWSINRCPVDDCGAANQVLVNAGDLTEFLAVDDTDLYFYRGISHELSRCAKSDCSQVTSLSERQSVPGTPMTALVVDERLIYVSGINGYTPTPYSCQCLKPDCLSCPVQLDQTVIVAADDRYVYASGRRAPKPAGQVPDGGVHVPVDAGGSSFSSGGNVAVAGGFAYWITPEPGGLWVLVRTPTS